MAAITISFKNDADSNKYVLAYHNGLDSFRSGLSILIAHIQQADLNSPQQVDVIRRDINDTRMRMKAMDFWFRYLEPIMYNKVNAPIPVEWENEVFEKFEKPYRRDGAGLMLAYLYLDEKDPSKDSLLSLVKASVTATQTYGADSITDNLKTPDHFFLCNRLFLLNLAAIYTTGFECPDTARIIPELRGMMADVDNIYSAFDQAFPQNKLPDNYLALYHNAIKFINDQPVAYSAFNHFIFIKDYVNSLYAINQKLIRDYHVMSKSFNDYTLNNDNNSIFNKSLYTGQSPKGIFMHIDNEEDLDELNKLGKMLFFDPMLSGNNQRSCASCHKPNEYYTDTNRVTSMQFNHKDFLVRNTPSLVNVQYNQLIMLDGKHISLQNQAKGVITSPIEMGCEEKEVLQKVLSCPEYKKGFEKLLKYTPQEKEITFDHIVSALTFYYTKYSRYYSPFDDAMNSNKPLNVAAQKGFNLFMSRAQCGTCHYVPEFNGVKPPYVSSEFEVLGVPQDTSFKQLSTDSGRYLINPAFETMHAFRTGSIRNAQFTSPYMHNGVFRTLNQVIDFYDAGGGVGEGLKVANQTLPADSLKLTKEDKANLLAFIKSLNEDITFEDPPEKLPASKNKALNKRKVGGVY